MENTSFGWWLIIGRDFTIITNVLPRAYTSKMPKNKGFTLVELLIVVAIISITMSIGLPSFQSIIADSKLTSSANAMLSAYQLARMEALKQHKNVNVTGEIITVDGVDTWKSWQVIVEGATDAIEKFESSQNITITKQGDVTGYSANGRQYSVNTPNENCGIDNVRPPLCGFTFKNSENTRTLVIINSGRLKVTNP